MEARSDLLVLGIGQPLRQDDAVGLVLAQRLRRHFGPGLHCLDLHELDIALAEEIAAHDHLLVIDARRLAPGVPFAMTPLRAAEQLAVPGGFMSHIFDWSLLLALACQLFAGATRAELLGVGADQFGFSEDLSPTCAQNAERAFEFLTRYCAASAQANASAPIALPATRRATERDVERSG